MAIRFFCDICNKEIIPEEYDGLIVKMCPGGGQRNDKESHSDVHQGCLPVPLQTVANDLPIRRATPTPFVERGLS